MPLDYIERSFDLFHLGQYLLVLDDIFIRGQQDIKLPAAELRHKPTTQSRSALQWGTHKKKGQFYALSQPKSEYYALRKIETTEKVFLTL